MDLWNSGFNPVMIGAKRADSDRIISNIKEEKSSLFKKFNFFLNKKTVSGKMIIAKPEKK
jgi:hypothetical protein